jgi:hypothetical protein
LANKNQSRLNLIFEGTENSVRDIYYCSTFKTDETLSEGNVVFLDFYKDEEAAFNPSPELAIKLQKFKSAYEEIIKPGDVYLTKEVYTYWLQKHEGLFGMFQLPPMLYKPEVVFYDLYSYLKSILEYMAFEQESMNAAADYFNIDTENEKEILAWLVKYEALGDNLTLLLVDYFDDSDEMPYSLKLDIEDCNLNIDIEDIKSAYFFMLRFDEHYWTMLEKYTTLPNEQWHTLEEGTEASEKRTSLTYHLNKRGMLPAVVE